MAILEFLTPPTFNEEASSLSEPLVCVTHGPVAALGSQGGHGELSAELQDG